MKARNIALLAALPAAILSVNSAYAGVGVYGKINVSNQFHSADNNNGTVSAAPPAVQNGDIYDNNSLESNASRFGIKASTDLGDTGLKAVAKLEYQVNTDDGVDSSGDELSQRNIYGGLQGGFGAVIAGKFDTPLKESQGKVDLFNDLILGDIQNVLLGEIRADNIVMYSTPKLSDCLRISKSTCIVIPFDGSLAAHVALMSGEDSGLDTPSGAYTENNDFADYISASVVWENDYLYMALAHDTGSATTNVAPSATTTLPQIATQRSGAEITRFTTQWKATSDLALGFIYQTAKSADNHNTNGVEAIGSFGGASAPFGSTANWTQLYDEQDGYILSAQYTLNNLHVFKLQYGTSESNAIDQTATGTVTLQPTWNVTTADAGDDIKTEALSIGYDYMLDKKFKIFTYYTDYQAEQKNIAGQKREINADTLGVGFEYSFDSL